jgi:hypothetical protein
LCCGKRSLSRFSECSLWTQAMNWVMPHRELGGALRRLRRMGVPRLPVGE